MKEFKISEKSLIIWRIRILLPAFLCAFLTSFFFAFFSTLWLILTAVWLLIFLFFYLVYFPIRLKKLSLTVDGDTITLKSGVFYNITRTIKKDKIQFVRESKTPLCRFFNVKTFAVYSAGAKIFTPPIEDGDEFLRGILNES